MFRFYLLLISILLLTCGCGKKGRTATSEPEDPRVVAPARTADSPDFVTDGDRAERPVKPERKTKPDHETQKKEKIKPVTFPEKETEHVRIVNYNPFGGSDELTINLNELGRNFCYPYPGNKISDYGMRGRSVHTGLDIKAIPNDTVRAALSGVVRMSKTYSGYGNIVVIRHPCGLETAYAHNTRNLVWPNQVVFAGDPIALAGRTGRATTEHIHFEVRVMGEHIDPNLLLDTQNRTINNGNLYLKRKNGRILASGSALPQDKPASNGRLLADNANTGTSAVGSTPAPSRTDAHSASGSVYVVRKGDTLYSISRRFGMSVNELCNLNGISSGGILSIGQKLKVK